MNSIVKFFEFENQEIRFVDGKPVANDVAAILGYADPAQAIVKKVKAKNKGVSKMETPGGVQSVTVLEEAGIYQLIFGCKLPIAEQFQDWVFEVVLPSIRKTGKYEAPSQPVLPPHKVAVEKADAIAHITDTLSLDHPRLAQLLIDHAISDIMPTKLLEGTRLRGVVEIAEDMGFKCDHSSRVRLGQFVASSEVSRLKQSEDRLCNGTVRPINCYPDTEEVRAVIKQFFN